MQVSPSTIGTLRGIALIVAMCGLTGTIRAEEPIPPAVAAAKKPVAVYPIPFEGEVLEICVASNGKQMVVHANEGRDLSKSVYRLMECRSGKTLEVLSELKTARWEKKEIAASRVGDVVTIPTEEGSFRYDLAGMKKVDDAIAMTPARAQKELAERLGGEETPLIWVFPRKAPMQSPPLPWLVLTSDDDGATIKLHEWNVSDDTLGEPMKFDGNGYPILRAGSSEIQWLRNESPDSIVWTHLDRWSLKTRTKIATLKLTPPITTVDIRPTDDERALFLLEYMVQGLHIYDCRTGKWVAGLAGDGGFSAFDATGDGKHVVATGGEWFQGSLNPNKFYVYDLTAVIDSIDKLANRKPASDDE